MLLTFQQLTLIILLLVVLGYCDLCDFSGAYFHCCFCTYLFTLRGTRPSLTQTLRLNKSYKLLKFFTAFLAVSLSFIWRVFLFQICLCKS